MKAQEKVLDRIEQSFEIFKKSFIYLVIPFFCYYLFSFIFFGLIVIYLLFSGIFLSIFDTMDYTNFFLFFSNPKVVLLFTLAIFFGIIYLLLFIPFSIYGIKTIGDFFKGADKIDFKENFMYSLNRFIPIMKTYWYIFAYVALIPSLLFIFGGFIFNISYFMKLPDIFKYTGGVIMVISSLLFIIFSIYKGMKSTFSIYSAIDSDEYTISNFNKSVKITDKKWWRIVGNIFLIGIIVGLLSGIASNFFSIFFSNSSNIGNIFNEFNDKDLLKSFLSNFSFFNYFVSGFFEILIKTIGNVFIFIFIYVFYKRLFDEYDNINESLDDKEKNDLIIVDGNSKIEL